MKKAISKILSGVASLSIALVSCLSFFSHVALAAGTAHHADSSAYGASRTHRSDELVYSTNYFEGRYASGYISLDSSQVHPSSAVSSGNSRWSTRAVYYSTNSSLDDTHYVDWYDSAFMDGVAYDVRIKFAQVGSTDDRWSVTPYGSVVDDHAMTATYPGINGHNDYTNYDKTSHGVKMEFHFYEKDYDGGHHCGDPDYEVTFYGVMKMNDLDRGEGWNIASGGVQDVYVTNTTFVGRADDHKLASVCGTRTTTANAHSQSSGSIPSDGTDADAVWITFKGAPTAPFALIYWSNGQFISSIGYKGQTVNYTVVGSQPVSTSYDFGKNGTASYSLYQVKAFPEYPGYEGQFTGWNTSSSFDGTSYDPADINHNIVRVQTSNVSLYGKWVYNIETSAGTGGSITEGGLSYAADSSHSITATPDAGYYIKSLKVQYIDLDGEVVDLETLSASDLSDAGCALGDAYTYNISAIDRNYILNATFERIVHLTTSVLNGTIDPGEGTHEYPNGADGAVSYEPIGERYDLDKIIIDGVEQSDLSGISSNYTFEQMTEDHSIRVEYQPWYVIDTTVINGTITPDEDHIKAGSDRTIEYEPLNEYYRLVGVTVDGTKVDPEVYESEYPFADIQADHEVVVEYQPYRTGTIHFVDTDGNEIAENIEYEHLGDRTEFDPSIILGQYNSSVTDILSDGFAKQSDDVSDRDTTEDGNGFLDSAVGSHKDLYVVFEGARYGIIHYVDTEGNRLRVDTTYSNVGDPDNFDDTVTLAFYNQAKSDLIDEGYLVISDEVAQRDNWFLPEVESTKEMTVVFELQPPVITGLKKHPVSVLCLIDLGLVGWFMTLVLRRKPEEQEDVQN